MTEIADSLRLLYETTLEDRGDEYVISLPKAAVDDGTLAPDDVYRVALLEASGASQQSESKSDETATDSDSESVERSRSAQSPPVEEGDVRTVTIETLGDQGDGIAKVERGFILIVPDTRPGDRVEVEVTDVKDSVAFAEPVGKAEVR